MQYGGHDSGYVKRETAQRFYGVIICFSFGNETKGGFYLDGIDIGHG